MGTGGNDQLPFTATGNSMLALNYKTTNPEGELVWFVQFSPQGPGTSRQFEDVSDCHLMKICGKHLLLVGEKNGTYHALKPKNGERVWDIILTEHTPFGSFYGGPNSSGAADKSAVYVSSIFSPNGNMIDNTAAFDPQQVSTAIFAIRARDGKILWRNNFPGATFGGLTLANNLLVHTDTAGIFRILNKKTGAVLFTFANQQSSQQMFNALLGGTTVYKDKVYVPFGTGVGFSHPPFGPGGIIAFKNK